MASFGPYGASKYPKGSMLCFGKRGLILIEKIRKKRRGKVPHRLDSPIKDVRCLKETILDRICFIFSILDAMRCEYDQFSNETIIPRRSREGKGEGKGRKKKEKRESTYHTLKSHGFPARIFSLPSLNLGCDLSVPLGNRYLLKN